MLVSWFETGLHSGGVNQDPDPAFQIKEKQNRLSRKTRSGSEPNLDKQPGSGSDLKLTLDFSFLIKSWSTGIFNFVVQARIRSRLSFKIRILIRNPGFGILLTVDILLSYQSLKKLDKGIRNLQMIRIVYPCTMCTVKRKAISITNHGFIRFFLSFFQFDCMHLTWLSNHWLITAKKVPPLMARTSRPYPPP